jgi:hypothetical protein
VARGGFNSPWPSEGVILAWDFHTNIYLELFRFKPFRFFDSLKLFLFNNGINNN